MKEIDTERGRVDTKVKEEERARKEGAQDQAEEREDATERDMICRFNLQVECLAGCGKILLTSSCCRPACCCCCIGQNPRSPKTITVEEKE